ncbi:hypothetical protein BB560_006969 [Smittium megazygosporum]|uniref:Uncharacterized protein n=1 Tax=Smittium megazygosporum TaxID=133381 RepID=A0A2T9Y006_9FUNG|nr:hypothetical protein BB560_006969 [Smittium megazygosporum]
MFKKIASENIILNTEYKENKQSLLFSKTSNKNIYKRNPKISKTSITNIYNAVFRISLYPLVPVIQTTLMISLGYYMNKNEILANKDLYPKALKINYLFYAYSGLLNVVVYCFDPAFSSSFKKLFTTDMIKLHSLAPFSSFISNKQHTFSSRKFFNSDSNTASHKNIDNDIDFIKKEKLDIIGTTDENINLKPLNQSASKITNGNISDTSSFKYSDDTIERFCSRSNDQMEQGLNQDQFHKIETHQLQSYKSTDSNSNSNSNNNNNNDTLTCDQNKLRQYSIYKKQKDMFNRNIPNSDSDYYNYCSSTSNISLPDCLNYSSPPSPPFSKTHEKSKKENNVKFISESY